MPCTMERRERYDPEDIESLLQERGFDELLDEERAYVLRHLGGREEYEAMRALLLQVRADDHDRAELTAPPELRDDLMAMFRKAHQRPQWRIWLNSIGLAMWPKEMAQLWRPALAIASVALLITAGVWVARRAAITGEVHPLAELEAPRPRPTPAPQAAEGATEAHAPEQAMKAMADHQDTAEPLAPVAAASGSTAAEAEVGSAPSSAVVMEQVMESTVKTVASDDEADGKKTDRDAGSRTANDALVLGEKAAAAPASSHVVTESELARNQTLANATGVARPRKDAERGPSSIGSLAASPEVLALLATGW